MVGQDRSHSLGWATARTQEGTLIGFVNVAWDGSDHAFLIDPKTRGSFQRRGIGTRLVRLAAEQASAAGCAWLHVDFEPHLRAFLLRRLWVQTDRRGSDQPAVDLGRLAVPVFSDDA